MKAFLNNHIPQLNQNNSQLFSKKISRNSTVHLPHFAIHPPHSISLPRPGNIRMLLLLTIRGNCGEPMRD
jgi:hypothetical protein